MEVRVRVRKGVVSFGGDSGSGCLFGVGGLWLGCSWCGLSCLLLCSKPSSAVVLPPACSICGLCWYVVSSSSCFSGRYLTASRFSIMKARRRRSMPKTPKQTPKTA